jgi:uncharacterized phiE125 gp8 family phage protein
VQPLEDGEVRYRIRTVTPLDQVPLAVGLDDAKAFMKVEGSAEDATIVGMIRTGMEMVEKYSGHVLTEREMEMVTCGFPVLPELISIPRAPVTEILSIAYTDASTGEAVDLADGAWRWSDSAPDQLLPPWRQSWPSAADELGSVRIGFTAGYEEDLCPALLIEAVKKTVLQLYEGRCEGGRLSDEVQQGLRFPFGPPLL